MSTRQLPWCICHAAAPPAPSAQCCLRLWLARIVQDRSLASGDVPSSEEMPGSTLQHCPSNYQNPLEAVTHTVDASLAAAKLMAFTYQCCLSCASTQIHVKSAPAGTAAAAAAAAAAASAAYHPVGVHTHCCITTHNMGCQRGVPDQTSAAARSLSPEADTTQPSHIRFRGRPATAAKRQGCCTRSVSLENWMPR
jgi:hypothetical protein